MLDTAIGPVINIMDSETFKIHVTHIGKHNKFRYYDYETVLVAVNKTGKRLNQLIGSRVRCKVRYRDAYNRLYSEVELE